MPKTIFDIPNELDRKIEIYQANKGMKRKEDAIIDVLEHALSHVKPDQKVIKPKQIESKEAD